MENVRDRTATVGVGYTSRGKATKYVESPDSLPRNPAGKIIKGALR
jgi:acyl-CoA synthetase (AMP-forming)/AMP-acid ligase II